MIHQWIRNDPASQHALVLTDQRGLPVPQWLAGTVPEAGGRLDELPGEADLATRARLLRRIAQSFDLVVLHIAPSDVVPVAAFAAPGGPPVALLNHADHVFWLGASVSDCVINLRSISNLIAERRDVKETELLPIPLDAPADLPPRSAARRKLGISGSSVLLVTTGSALKFHPMPGHDFFAVMGTALDRAPGAELLIVGLSPNEAERRATRGLHPRIRAVGMTEDAWPYLAAADLFVECFPFGSQTAMLEACLAGVAPLLAYAPPSPLLCASDDAVIPVLDNAPTESAYLDRLVHLIGDRDARLALGHEVQERVKVAHTGTGWRQTLDTVYARFASLEHRPRELLPRPAERTQTDLVLSLWQDACRRFETGRTPSDDPRDEVAYMAYTRRQRGDYRGAAALLYQCARRWGCNRRMVLDAAKLFPHWLLRTSGAVRRPARVRKA